MANDLAEAGRREAAERLEAEKREARVKEGARMKLGDLLVKKLKGAGPTCGTDSIEKVFHWSTPVEEMIELRKSLREAGEAVLADLTHTLIMSRVKE